MNTTTRQAVVIGRRANYHATHAPPPPALARGTQNLDVRIGAAMAEHQVVMTLTMRAELATLGRNLATAAGLSFQYALGRAHVEFERLGDS